MSQHALPNATPLQWLLHRLTRVPGCRSIGFRLLARSLTDEQRRAMFLAWRQTP